MCFPQCGFETGGQKKGRERKEPECTGGILILGLKRQTGLFGCQWKLGGLEMPKGWFTLKKAVEQQEELSILFCPELGEAEPVRGCYHWAMRSHYFVPRVSKY